MNPCGKELIKMATKASKLKKILGALIGIALVVGVVFMIRSQMTPVSKIQPDGDMSEELGEEVEILQISQSACIATFQVDEPDVPTLSCTSKRAWKNEISNTASTYSLVTQITSVDPGDIVVYELNYSSTDLTSVTVTDILDTNLSYLDSASGCDYTLATRQVSCTIDTTTDPSGSVMFRASVDSDLVATTVISNTATLENTVANLSDVCEVDVTYTYVDPGNPSLSCTNKNAYTDSNQNSSGTYFLTDEILSSEYVIVGDQIVFNIEANNVGDVDAEDVVITDILPSSVAYVDSGSECSYDTSTRTIVCDLGIVAAGGTESSSIRVEVLTAGTSVVSNTATITSSNGQDSSCSVEVSASEPDGSPPPSPEPSPDPSSTPDSSPPVVEGSPPPSELPEAGIMTFTTGTVGIGLLLLLIGMLGILLI